MSIKRIYYHNGILESEVFEINGLMEGPYKSYYNNINREKLMELFS
jgi:antitoxin component YwqK of YwqJK toxin-antitoxin module